MRISDWSSDVCSSDLIGRLERRCGQRMGRCRIDDPPPFAHFHARYGGADGVKGGGQVDGDDRVPLVDRKLLDRRNMLDASIVHPYFERAERRLMLDRKSVW